MTEPYRPSNGSEGESFMEDWCVKCKHEQKEDNPCLILGATMAFNLKDKDYPKEWVKDENGPRCTAFQEIGFPDTVPRCEKTKDMFKKPNLPKARQPDGGE